ncbi:twin-arginine translocase subunit TatC [Nocardioides sp.]|uniref:twin-arginine translocase subunit TatC n=1 Tax=Nocardioides sp. TaxID=35761 RepID=UPI0039E703E6
MAVSDHFRELRARLIRAVLVWLVLFVVALFFYEPLLAILKHPYDTAVRGGTVDSEIVVSGIGGPLMLQLKLCAVAALIVASPWWLREIWGFLLPGLHKNERTWTRIFAAVAGPLFMAGVALGYYVLPKGIRLLIEFTPLDTTNLVDFDDYFGFIVRMLLIFGIAFEIPLFVVMLNLAGVVSGKMLGKYRAWIVMGTMLFAAVATPSPDALTMLMLALPMLVLFLIAEVIARLVDRARGRREKGTELWDDDEVSPI